MHPPDTELSQATGIVGVVSLSVSVYLTSAAEIAPINASVIILVCTCIPMILWDVIVKKVHRNASTELDFEMQRPYTEVFALARVKIIGFVVTIFLVALCYLTVRTYSGHQFKPYFLCLALIFPVILVIAPIYIFAVSRHMTDPRDGLWHFGMLVCFDFAAVDSRKVNEHLRGWAIKTFFLAYVASILPGVVSAVLNFDFGEVIASPHKIFLYLVAFLFLCDVCFGTIGYIVTFRVLDSHIRSSNHRLIGWVAALSCYPPFILMGSGGPLDYRKGTQEWTYWLEGNSLCLFLWGSAILALVFIYAWSTVAFGLRFSNLTNRGIITSGPFRYFRHPAYFSKNAMWWLTYLPFLTTSSTLDGIRNSVLLLSVNFIYFLRARTEELHLMEDHQYRVYSDWISRNGLLSRLLNRLGTYPFLYGFKPAGKNFVK